MERKRKRVPNPKYPDLVLSNREDKILENVSPAEEESNVVKTKDEPTDPSKICRSAEEDLADQDQSFIRLQRPGPSSEPTKRNKLNRHGKYHRYSSQEEVEVKKQNDTGKTCLRIP